jgi:hypothetical protein
MHSNFSAGMMPSYMDVCVGTRVRIVSNILTECVIYNGAMGTVWGYVYKGEGPKTVAQRVPVNFSSLEDYQRELEATWAKKNKNTDNTKRERITSPGAF